MAKKKRKEAVPAPAPGLPPLEKNELLAALSCTALVFLVYLLTLAPSIMGGDSGELTLMVYHGGVPHPPGYPLFILLGKLFGLLPIRSFAWRINLLSATCSSIAAGLLCLSSTRLTRNIWCGILSAGLYAFSPLIWSYSVVAEVFALNNFFIAGLLLILVEYSARKTFHLALFCAFWLGLALSNHHTFVFYALPASAWILWSGRSTWLNLRNLSVSIAAFATGFLPYLYLPWASFHSPLSTWGDQKTWSGFLTHFLRKEYGTFSLSTDQGGQASLFEKLSLFFMAIPGELGFAGLVLVALGIYSIFARKKERLPIVPKLALAACLLYVTIFSHLSNLNYHSPLHVVIQFRFWQQANIVLFLLAGAGGAWLWHRLQPEYHRYAAVAALLIVTLQLGLHYKGQDQSRNFVFRDFSHFVLRSLPENSLLLTSGDHITHAIRYFQNAEKIRPDIRVVDHATLTTPWYKDLLSRSVPDVIIPGALLSPGMPGIKDGYTIKTFLEANQSRFQIFLVNGWRINDESHEQGFETWPHGLTEQILPKNAPPSIGPFISTNDDLFAKYPLSGVTDHPIGSWEHELYRLYWRNRYSYGAHLLSFALQGEGNQPLFSKAAENLAPVESAMNRTKPELFVGSAVFYKYLGITYQRLHKKEEARAALDKYLAKLPVASPEHSWTVDFLKTLN